MIPLIIELPLHSWEDTTQIIEGYLNFHFFSSILIFTSRIIIPLIHFIPRAYPKVNTIIISSSIDEIPLLFSREFIEAQWLTEHLKVKYCLNAYATNAIPNLEERF